MNSVREKLKNLPSRAVAKILKKAFMLPTPAARFFINDLTKVRKSHLPWIYKVKIDPHSHQDWHGCWIAPNVRKLSEDALSQRIQEADLIIFFVHGGGFRAGSSTMYMETMIAWLQALKNKHNVNAMIMSIDYRLAPEHRYPSGVEDVVHAYAHLIQNLNVSNKKVIVSGDQAGASLLLEMLFITHDPSMFEIAADNNQPVVPELPRPAGFVLISPVVTDKRNSESWKVNQKYDYITEYSAKVTIREYYEPIKEGQLDEEEEREERTLGIMNLETGFSQFLAPELLMYVGQLEVLRDDALLLASKAEKDGINCQTVVEKSVHNWYCVRELVKDKSILKKADDTLADFCARVIGKQYSVQNHYTTAENQLDNDYSLKSKSKEDLTDDTEDLSLSRDSLALSALSLFDDSDTVSSKRDSSTSLS